MPVPLLLCRKKQCAGCKSSCPLNTWRARARGWAQRPPDQSLTLGQSRYAVQEGIRYAGAVFRSSFTASAAGDSSSTCSVGYRNCNQAVLTCASSRSKALLRRRYNPGSWVLVYYCGEALSGATGGLVESLLRQGAMRSCCLRTTSYVALTFTLLAPASASGILAGSRRSRQSYLRQLAVESQ